MNEKIGRCEFISHLPIFLLTIPTWTFIPEAQRNGKGGEVAKTLSAVNFD
jgi:hypothetical protein